MMIARETPGMNDISCSLASQDRDKVLELLHSRLQSISLSLARLKATIRHKLRRLFKSAAGNLQYSKSIGAHIKELGIINKSLITLNQ
jgi:two-component sensor histidine kinase